VTPLRHRAEKLALIRRLLAIDENASDPLATIESKTAEPTEDPGYRCPHCGQPALRLLAETDRPSLASLVASTYRGSWLDST